MLIIEYLNVLTAGQDNCGLPAGPALGEGDRNRSPLPAG